MPATTTVAKKVAAMNKLFTEYLKGGYDDICDYPTYRRARLKGMNHIKRIYYKLIYGIKKTHRI
jgi:hypothetical protein